MHFGLGIPHLDVLTYELYADEDGECAERSSAYQERDYKSGSLNASILSTKGQTSIRTAPPARCNRRSAKHTTPTDTGLSPKQSGNNVMRPMCRMFEYKRS